MPGIWMWLADLKSSPGLGKFYRNKYVHNFMKEREHMHVCIIRL